MLSRILAITDGSGLLQTSRRFQGVWQGTDSDEEDVTEIDLWGESIVPDERDAWHSR